MMIGRTGKEFSAALILKTALGPAAGVPLNAFAIHSMLKVKFPDEDEYGLPSAKSHVIGIACRAKVFRRASILGLLSQEQIEDPRSALRLTANARYVATASA